MTDMMYGAALGAGDIVEDTTNDYYGVGYAGGNLNNANQPRQRFPGLYVGNLTWWTTDRDVIDAINSIGITDIQEVKFFENRNNGQSKGFCVVTFTSEASLPAVIEKLPTKELHGQNPVVTQYNRQNLNLFETQTKPRPQINSSNGPTPHAAGIMGINSISGVHAAANAQAAAVAAVAGMPYTGINATPGGGGYNQGGLNSLGGSRPPTFHPNMMRPMRGPRPMMRGTMPGSMNNGSMLPGGHQMNRMRFMQPSWNNSQGGSYNSAASRIGPQINLDMSNRIGGMKQGDDSGQDMLTNSSAQSYYTPHHPSSQSDHYRSDIRDHRDLRDERDSGSRRIDERSSRLDDRSLRHDDRSRDDRPRDDRQRDDRHRDDRSSKQDERSERSERSRREERPSRKEDDRSSRRGADDIRREREDRTARREEKPSRHRERSHRSGERVRSRSRSRDRASREGKERRDRERDRGRERY